MAEETNTTVDEGPEETEEVSQEEEKEAPAPEPVVYLYGAQSDRRNRNRRRRTGRTPRQIRLGPHGEIIVRRGRRISVTEKWVKENADEVRRYVGDLLWIEDSMRRRVSEEKLKKLGVLPEEPLANVTYPAMSPDQRPVKKTEETEEGSDEPESDEDEEETSETEESEEVTEATSTETEVEEPGESEEGDSEPEATEEEVEEPEEEEKPAPDTEVMETKPYEEWDYNDLKKEVSKRKLETDSMRKEDLVAALELSDEE